MFRRKLVLIIYYGFAQFIPMQPFPTASIGYSVRALLGRLLFGKCGRGVIIKDRCYFGDGSRLTVGDRSQLGQRSHLAGTISIGSDVLMGPDVVMMATSHEHARIDIPMMEQGEAQEKAIRIGDDVWVGTRAIILPGVEVGAHSIVAAGAVVTRSFPEFSVIGGVPAKRVGDRREKGRSKFKIAHEPIACEPAGFTNE